MYQDDWLQKLLWMKGRVDISSFYVSKWCDQVPLVLVRYNIPKQPNESMNTSKSSISHLHTIGQARETYKR
jgi:hypothetical protein